MTAPSEDRFLDGRVRVRQFRDGFRAGLDAVMLAAAVPAGTGDEVLELGAGSGVASLCLAARVGGASVTGVEIDPRLAALANENAAANGMKARVRFVEADIFALPRAWRREFSHVMCNPPFHDAEGRKSPSLRRDASLRDRGTLGLWMDIGLKRVAGGGTFTTIVSSSRLGQVLSHLPDKGVTICPLWPDGRGPAKRVILQAKKASRSHMVLLQGLVLHAGDGSYTPAANAVLRGGAALGMKP
jgi:tRNA1(Val) A37 N6-methylase TrmN6